MAKAEINTLVSAWLADSDSFEEGLRLYQRFGTNEALKTIFQRSGATAYNHEKLVEELGKLRPPAATVDRPDTVGRPPASKDKPTVGRPPAGRPSAVPTRGAAPTYAVPANHPELVKRYRQRAMWKSQLTLLPTQEERRDQAFAILDLTDEIEGILYNGFSNPQGSDEQLPNDRADLAKRLSTNGKYISKYRDREDKQEEISRRRAENERIEKIISPS